MSEIIIPKTLVVGFQKRAGTFDGKLAFITYKKPDGTIFNETRFRKWINCPEILEFDNFPQTGFSMGDSVSHGGYMCDTVVNVRIYSTQIDAEFEITIDNFLAIARYSNINRKFIEGNCVFGWKDTRVNLLSLEAPEYASVRKYSDNLYKPKSEKKAVDLSTHKFGDIFTSEVKKDLIGKHLTFLGKYQESNILKNKKLKKSDFVHIGDNKEGQALFDVNETFSDIYLFGVMCKRIDSTHTDNSTINFGFFQKVIALDSKDVELFAEAEEYGNVDIVDEYFVHLHPGYERRETKMKYIELAENFSTNFTRINEQIEELTKSFKKNLSEATIDSHFLDSINYYRTPEKGTLWLEDKRLLKFSHPNRTLNPEAIAYMEKGKMVFKPVQRGEVPSNTKTYEHLEVKTYF